MQCTLRFVPATVPDPFFEPGWNASELRSSNAYKEPRTGEYTKRNGGVAEEPRNKLSGDTNCDPPRSCTDLHSLHAFVLSVFDAFTRFYFLVFRSCSCRDASGSAFINFDRINPLLRFSRKR